MLRRLFSFVDLALFVSLLLFSGCSSLDIIGWSDQSNEEVKPHASGSGSSPSQKMSSGGRDTSLPGSGGSEAGGAKSGHIDEEELQEGGARNSGPRNILEERVDVPLEVVNEKLNEAFEQLFFGDPSDEAIYRDEGDGTAYVEDIYHEDVRTDTMGYGMMIAVQLDKQAIFDKLWSWSKDKMLNTEGTSKGLLNWQCNTDGTSCVVLAATDSTSMISTTLFLADKKWGSSSQHDYIDDAHSLIDAMTQIEERNANPDSGVFDCFDFERSLPRRDSTNNQQAVPVEYLMPAYYELWAKKRPSESDLWLDMATNSRKLLGLASHPTTGLYPEAITYSGLPQEGEQDYRSSTSRTLLNLALDEMHHGPFSWISQQNETLLDFFLEEGIEQYAAEYSLEGEPLVSFNTPAHRSLVALAAGTTGQARHDIFLLNLMDEPIPTGQYRYFDGILYLLSLVVLSGQFELN